MKNKQTLLLVIAVAILAVIAYFVTQDNNGRKPLSDFAIEHVESIDKIIITEINGHKVKLEKNKEIWNLNDKFRARPESIELLLKTFKNIKVQSSVSSELKKTIIANLGARHKKVEIFVDGKLNKTYFVGSPTKNHYGTYMLLEKNGVKSSEPFITHIPGFNGFLESRFFTNENDWKYSGVFVYKPEEIAEITTTLHQTPDQSYTITHSDKIVGLQTINKEKLEGYNKLLVENYILNYEKIYFNRIAEFGWEKIDSIKKTTPEYSLSVKDKQGKVTKVDFYLKPIENEEINEVTGERKLWDENYILGIKDNENQVMVFQYYLFS